MCTAMRFEVQVKGFRWVGGVTGQEAYTVRRKAVFPSANILNFDVSVNVFVLRSTCYTFFPFYPQANDVGETQVHPWQKYLEERKEACTQYHRWALTDC